MIERQLMLVELTENSTNIQMRVSLYFGPLKFGFNRKGLLQEIQSGAHFTNAAVITSHIVECHGLAELIVFTQLF